MLDQLLARLRAPRSSLLDSSHRPVAPDASSPHAVVIGAGFGGLAAAVRLLVRGYRVTVVDRLDQAGGRARVFRQDGFVFDAGPTLITAPWLFEELWEIAGKKMSDHVEMVPISPFYRITWDDGAVFEYTGDAESMREQIRKLAPGDVEGYERFLAHSERIFHIGFSELAHVPFSKVKDMARIVPDMMLLENFRSVFGLVSKYVSSERLRQVLSFHPLLVGGNPLSTSSIYALIAYLERTWGVWFAKGGTGTIVAGLVSLIEELGGQVRLGAEVEEIVVEPGTTKRGRARGVRLRAHGEGASEVIPADLVVSNADSAWTYRYLVRPEYRRVWTDLRLEKLSRYSMGLFVWYFGTNKRYEDVAHHTILLGPRYEELLRDIFDRKRLSEDFSLYLHRPTATDTSMAPDGCDAFYVLSPVPHLGGGADWEKERERYRKSIESYLEAQILPGLSGAITTSRTLDPKDFLVDYLAFRGNGFGMEPVLQQSAYFRPHNQSEDVEGLYLVGAGTHPGAGMPGVLSSARVLDSVVPDPPRVGVRR